MVSVITDYDSIQKLEAETKIQIQAYQTTLSRTCPVKFMPGTWYYVNFYVQRYEAYLYQLNAKLIDVISRLTETLLMLKDIIEKMIKQNNSVARFVEDASQLYQDGKDIMPAFIDKLEKTSFNSELGNSFAEILQLSADPEVYEQFELSDISRLYESLRDLQKSNIDTFIDSGYFEFSVMDNPKKAQAIAAEGLKIAKEKVQALEKLLRQIEAEDA